MKIALQVAGVLGWGAVFFALVFYIAFPSRSASERIAYEAQERLGLAVNVDKPRPKLLAGVRFKSLELGKIGPDGTPRSLLSMGKTWIKIKPIAALRGKYDVDFDGVLYEGHARGNVQYSEAAVAADVELDELEVRAFPLQGETYNIDGAGTFDSEIELNLDQADITKSEGEITFDFDGLAFREGSQIYGMDVETVFTEAAGLITVADGRATVDWARFRGDKLEGEISGYISLKEDLLKSRLALKIKFKLVDETLEGLMAIKSGGNPSNKDSKGYYHYLISGPLERPKPREDRAGARRSNRGRDRTATTPADDENQDGGGTSSRRGTEQRGSTRLDEMTDEERAEWEAEREERREALRLKREERRADVESKRDTARSSSRPDGTFSDDIQVGSTVRTDGRLPAPGTEDEMDEEEFDEEEYDEGEEDIEEGDDDADEGEYVEEGEGEY